MAQVHEVEIWVIVNESGEWEVGTGEDEAVERFNANCSADENRRRVCLKLQVPVPETVTLTGAVPGGADGEIALVAQ